MKADEIEKRQKEYKELQEQFNLIGQRIQQYQFETNKLAAQRSEISAKIIRLDGWFDGAGVKNVQDKNRTNL